MAFTAFPCDVKNLCVIAVGSLAVSLLVTDWACGGSGESALPYGNQNMLVSV